MMPSAFVGLAATRKSIGETSVPCAGVGRTRAAVGARFAPDDRRREFDGNIERTLLRCSPSEAVGDRRESAPCVGHRESPPAKRGPTRCDSRPKLAHEHRMFVRWRLAEVVIDVGAAAQEVLEIFGPIAMAREGRCWTRWNIGADPVQKPKTRVGRCEFAPCRVWSRRRRNGPKRRLAEEATIQSRADRGWSWFPGREGLGGDDEQARAGSRPRKVSLMSAPSTLETKCERKFEGA